MSLLDTLANFVAGPWRRGAAVKTRIGYYLLGIGPYGVGRPNELTNPALHRHAVKAIYRVFGDDPFWCMLVATGVYLQKCNTPEEIDRIVSEHGESRAGAFPTALHHGHGWDPGRALSFLGDQAEYRRAYICTGGDKWISIEQHLDPASGLRDSGYKLEGRRGCVQTITFIREEDERQAAAVASLAHRFAIEADRLIRGACVTQMPDSLRHAIATRAKYDGLIDPANVNFAFMGSNTQDWTSPPTVCFTLRLNWRLAALQVDDGSI